ncbi:hypothetical protein [Dactylosporangium maewongense]|uniref:hypothetical protein n=1 Tax=Dactylosporangium maewongense TaxID=634393 RepID=UPI0031DAED27
MARRKSGNVVDRHPTIVVLPLLLMTAIGVSIDAQRLIAAMSERGWSMVTATVAGAALGVVSVAFLFWSGRRLRRSDTDPHQMRSSATVRISQGVGAVWVIACFVAFLVTHPNPQFHTAEEWRLTTAAQTATLAYLLALALALTIGLFVTFVVLPVLIRRENSRRRRASARQQAAQLPLP